MSDNDFPALRFPRVTLVVAEHPERGGGSTLNWSLGNDHPLVDGARVIGLFFLDRDGIEVYSMSSDRTTGIRDYLPMARIRHVQEAMPPDIFITEFLAADGGDDDDDDDDGGEGDDDDAAHGSEENSHVNNSPTSTTSENS